MRASLLVLLLFGWLGCGSGPAPAPAGPAAPAATLRLPDDAVVMIELDLPRLRASALWPPARRVIGLQSSFALSCPAVFAGARRVSAAIRGPRDVDASPGTTFVILHGIDGAAARACLRQPVAAPAPTPRTACEQYDAGIEDLAACADVPRSAVGDLQVLPRLFGSSLAPEQTCAVANVVIRRALARREELGAPCDDRLEGWRATPVAHATPVDDRTFVLDDRELIYLADDHTALTIRVEPGHAASPGALAGELRALLAGTGPRWFDAAITRNERAAWFAIEATAFQRQDERRPARGPLRVFGELSVAAGATLELRMPRAQPGDPAFQALDWLAAGAKATELGALDLRTTCTGTPCDATARLVMPLAQVEAAKLVEVLAAEPREDCRPAGGVRPIVNGVGLVDQQPIAEVRASRERYWMVALSRALTGDRAWIQHAAFDYAVCRGPMNLVGEALRAIDGCNTNLDHFDLVPKAEREASGGVKLCRGGACTILDPGAPVGQLSTDTGGKLIAMVAGKPGAQVVETWDPASGQRVSRFPVKTKQCASVQLLDGTLLIGTGACGAALPSDAAYFARTDGKRIAAAPTGMLATPVAVGPSLWAFIAQTGDKVVVVNVATGTADESFATGAAVEPGMVAAGSDGENRVVLAYGGATARSGSVTLLDLSTGALTERAPLPVCP